MTPEEIVSELDKHIVGQQDAKRAVAIALRNRWRRQQVPEPLRHEITPKNILMIGPTGVGKTEIARRLARLADAPFVKVEATKFTEVGYVGRDVDTIIRDLVEMAIKETREAETRKVRDRAADDAEERVLDVLIPPVREVNFTDLQPTDSTTRQKFRKMLREGALDDHEVEIEVAAHAGADGDHGAARHGGAHAARSRACSSRWARAGRSSRKMTVARGDEGCSPTRKPRGSSTTTRSRRKALAAAEQNGIVFLDEIDKIASRPDAQGADVSRQGVQRDLLPLVEGTTVTTKYGMVKTDHILFIASGAFHLSKPSDLIPELQGRFPIRVELVVAVGGRLREDPHRHRRLPDAAVRGAARHREGAPRVPARRHPAPRRDRVRGQRAAGEHRRAPAVHGDGAAARRRLVRRRAAHRGARHRSTPRSSTRRSPASPATTTSRKYIL